MQTWKKISFVAIGFCESLIFSGLIFGWPSLVHVFQIEGVYSHLCITAEGEENEGLGNFTEIMNGSGVDGGLHIIKCPEQDNMFGLLYTVMLAAFGIPSVAIGFSLDYLGLRLTRLVGSTMVTCGFIFLAFATSETPWTIWPGMLTICLGANTFRLCALQYGNAWPAKRATIMFLYTSAHAVSTTVFLMFQYANAVGISLRISAFTVSIICGLTFVSTFILPRMRVEEPTTPEKENSIVMVDKEQVFLDKSREAAEGGGAEVNNLQTQKSSEGNIPLGASIKTMSFGLHMIWLINVYMLRFYITSFNTWAWKTTSDPSQVGFYNTFAGTCSLISPFISPIGGVVTDYLTQKAGRVEDKTERLASKFQAPSLILCTTTALIMSVYLCKLSYSPIAVYASIVLVSIARPVTIASVYTYVRIRFYPEHFNRLTGLGFTLISIACLLHYPMYRWLFSSDESYTVASYTFCVLILLTFASPGHLLIRKFPLRYAKHEIRHRKNV